MNQARIAYAHNTEPRRGLAAAGIFVIKAIMTIPHMIILGPLSQLAFAAAYVGYWIVAFTGRLPTSIQTFGAWNLRWQTRLFGWYFGLEDRYPPFEIDAPEYSLDMEVPSNEEPNQGWAIAGIFLIKALAIIPHAIVLFLLLFLLFPITWFGYIITAFTGRLPTGIQDYAAGVLQWEARVVAWLTGLTDDYPPFVLSADPTR